MGYTMKPQLKTTLTIAAITLIAGALGSGCAHKKVAENETGMPAVEQTDLGSSDTGNALGLKTVHFGFDTATLDKTAKSILRDDAQVLKSNPDVKIQIEGHCDARGGIQYNLALGERRAKAAQHYLEDRGVAASRMTTISYGKERPLVQGDTEEAYAQNRRDNLVITKK